MEQNAIDEAQATGDERRSEPRYRLEKKLIAQTGAVGWRRWFSSKLNVLINNVSERGVGLHCKANPPARGSNISLHVLALGEPRVFAGKVRHVAQVQSGYLFGVELKDMETDSLISYLKACEVELEIR